MQLATSASTIIAFGNHGDATATVTAASESLAIREAFDLLT